MLLPGSHTHVDSAQIAAKSGQASCKGGRCTVCWIGTYLGLLPAHLSPFPIGPLHHIILLSSSNALTLTHCLHERLSSLLSEESLCSGAVVLCNVIFCVWFGA